MALTSTGYAFVASALLGVGLTIGVGWRRRRKDSDAGIGPTLFIGLVLVQVSILFGMLFFFLADSVHDMVVQPKYDAEIVDFESRWEEVTRSDDEDTWTEDVLMHTPILRFVDRTGRTVTIPGNVSSGAEPVIGDTVRVAYGDGRVQVITVASIGLLFGGGIICAILGYILLHAVYYTIGRSQTRLGAIGMNAVFYGLIPLGILGMFAGLLWGGVIAFFREGSDVPVWAFGVSLFFCVVLALAAVGLVVGPAKGGAPKGRRRRRRRG